MKIDPLALVQVNEVPFFVKNGSSNVVSFKLYVSTSWILQHVCSNLFETFIDFLDFVVGY